MKTMTRPQQQQQEKQQSQFLQHHQRDAWETLQTSRRANKDRASESNAISIIHNVYYSK
jgi:hypothetical protein